MKCHICNKESNSFIDEKTNIKYYHCNDCQYFFKSPEYYQTLSKQKERYDLHQNFEESEGYRVYFQQFLDFVIPLINTPKKVLDFGCGSTSLLSKILKEKGIECEFYDAIYYPNTINFSHKERYDLIISMEVFEHLHSPKETFKSLLSILKPNGYLAIQTQFHFNNINCFKRWYYNQDSTHIVFFTAHTFQKLSNNNSSEVIATNNKNIVIIKKLPIYFSKIDLE